MISMSQPLDQKLNTVLNLRCTLRVKYLSPKGGQVVFKMEN